MDNLENNFQKSGNFCKFFAKIGQKKEKMHNFLFKYLKENIFIKVQKYCKVAQWVFLISER